MNSFPDFILAQVLDYCHHKNYRSVSQKWNRVLNQAVIPEVFDPSRISPVILVTNSGRIDWEDVSKKCQFSEEFMNLYGNVIDWDLISYSQKLSEEFMEINAHRFNWYLLSIHQNLSEEFIEKHADQVHWQKISKFQRLSENFMIKWIKRLDEKMIRENQIISEDFADWWDYCLYLSRDNGAYDEWFENNREKVICV